MKIPRLILDYSKLTDASLNQKAIDVITSLTDNPNFPVTTPTSEAFTALQTAYATALSKTVTGDRTLIALKNQSKAELLNAMRQLAMDIDALANGDRAKLMSSGFDLASSGDGGASISTPSDFKILDGMNTGELKFMCKRVPYAVGYILEHTDEAPTENTIWKIQPSSTREFTVRGLRSGIRVYGRIKAIGRKGQEANSDVLSRVVQ